MVFVVDGLLWRVSFLLFQESNALDHGGRCNTFTPELTKPHRQESQSEGGREGIGCCTCLLPWGFWRSDYAGCRFIFTRVWLAKKKRKNKKECTWAGVSVANYVEGICFRPLRRLCSDHERGPCKVPLMFSYCYLTLGIKLRRGGPGAVRIQSHLNEGKTMESWWRFHNCMFPR